MNSSYNAWSLVALSPLPLVWRVIACALVIAACGYLVWTYRGSPRRVWLTVTRLLAGLCVIGILVEPAIQLRSVRKLKNRLALVADRSTSMALPAASGGTRYDQFLALLTRESSALAALAEQHVMEWLDLAGPVSDATLRSPPKDERTDLLKALETARGQTSGRPLAGLVLFSDGADNASLEDPAHPGTLSSTARDRLKALGAPVNTVNVTPKGAFTDISIVDVIADEFAFVHNTISVEVQILATGFSNLTTDVTLRREGEIIAKQEVALAAGVPQTVTFKTKPDKIGEFVYTVSVPVQAGEAVPSNNERSFALQVIRDKIRVLQVAGRPSWDERFLRQHLKENPNVDLISFFILRTPGDDTRAGDSELSLIPFPVERLFTTELASFDIIVFQNFDFRPYNMERFLGNIAQAVKNGLGFVMIGGDQSFADGGYRGTPIEGILPLRLEQSGVAVERVKPALTDAGRRHPATDLARGGANERIWSQLPPWPSVNRVGGLAPGATALVNSSVGPAIASMDVGEGRAMAIATDSLWRWRLSSLRDGGSAQRAYHRFWSNTLRWLVRDPEHSRVQVTPEKRRFDEGESVDVGFTVRESDYTPVPGGSLEVTLERGVGPQLTQNAQTNDQGTARLAFEGLETGAYRVRAKATRDGREIGTGEAVFVVESRSIETARAAPRPELLRAIADATGGRAFDVNDSLADVKVVDPDVVEVDRRRNIELWDNAWALIAMIAIFGADWALRRRSGYL